MMKCPSISEFFLISDDAKLTAALCCVLAKPGSYLPVCEGPRLQRPDSEAEVTRIHNAVIRAKSKKAFLTGLSEASDTALMQTLSRRQIERIKSPNDLAAIPSTHRKRQEGTLNWGRNKIGIGLLKALRSGQQIAFSDEISSDESVPSLNGHIVVCEEGEDMSEIIAANYAYALGAGLTLIPPIDRQASDDILERFYTLYDPGQGAPDEAERFLKSELQALCRGLQIPTGGSITFISKLPFGFAFNDYPSAHLFEYPALGIVIVNGFAAEQPGTHGLGIITLVDPGTTPAPEIQSSEEEFRKRGAFIRTIRNQSATVRRLSETISYFPFDLMILATHCGDSSGYRWTYKYADTEGRERALVTDIAIGVERTDEPNMLRVAHYTRFVSLDGVDWSDPVAKANLYVGTAIIDFLEKTKGSEPKLKPVIKETIPRVIGSAALKMHDHNYLFMHHTIADAGTPIIINNACLSWHRLAGGFTFAGARAYIGTLFPILPIEAENVLMTMLRKHWGKPLPIALWAAQKSVYSTSARRPYIMTGVFPQRLRIKLADFPKLIYVQLRNSFSQWRHRFRAIARNDKKQAREVLKILQLYQRELSHFKEQYISKRHS